MEYSNMMDTGTLWWSEIAGPAKLVADIQNALAEGQSVICNVTTSLSFRWTFRDTISHWLSERSVTVVHVDCRDVYCEEDITEFLLRQIQPDKLTGYQRRRSPQYMRDNGILHGKLLWIRGVAPEYVRSWIQYISSYRSHDLDHGLFFMEVQQTPSARIPTNLRFVDHDRYIRRDDLRLYTSVLVENYMDACTGVKQYAVELASALCVVDGELANNLLTCSGFITEEPMNLLQQIVSDSYSDSPRGQEIWHPFTLLRAEKNEEITYRIWSAQVRVGYPQIELERREMISRWYSELGEALSVPYLDDKSGQPKRFTDYEGNPITDPRELEVGMLLKIASVRRADDTSQYLFYLPDQEARDRIHLLRKCRNELAHLCTCDSKMFYELVSRI